jgi:hypothetical protein
MLSTLDLLRPLSLVAQRDKVYRKIVALHFPEGAIGQGPNHVWPSPQPLPTADFLVIFSPQWAYPPSQLTLTDLIHSEMNLKGHLVNAMRKHLLSQRFYFVD